jgi:hypothetical protein
MLAEGHVIVQKDNKFPSLHVKPEIALARGADRSTTNEGRRQTRIAGDPVNNFFRLVCVGSVD